MTGMFLQISCSAISVRRANPDIAGKSTSVNMRSMLWGLPFSISQAFKPSGTAVTAQTINKTFQFQKHHVYKFQVSTKTQ